MESEHTDNFLLAFDYKLPPMSKPVKKILFIHSSRTEQSFLSFKRVSQIYPSAEFFLLKNRGVEFPHCGLENAKELAFDGSLPPDFHLSEGGRFLKNADIDLIFFCVNSEIRPAFPDPPISFRYGNIFKFLNNLELLDWACIVDNRFCVYYPHQIGIQSASELLRTDPLELGNIKMELPFTMLFEEEKQALFDLAGNGTSRGAIVNIGTYLGGSSIILAAASKAKNREKVHSFDLKIHEQSQGFYAKNGVDDWIVPREMDSVEAAKNWLDEKKGPIRLLFIDGDHSLDGCRNDIIHWTKSLAPDGIIAVHDYGNIGLGAEFSEVVRAVYETVVSSSEFHDFKRVDTLFYARKKAGP